MYCYHLRNPFLLDCSRLPPLTVTHVKIFSWIISQFGEPLKKSCNSVEVLRGYNSISLLAVFIVSILTDLFLIVLLLYSEDGSLGDSLVDLTLAHPAYYLSSFCHPFCSLTFLICFFFPLHSLSLFHHVPREVLIRVLVSEFMNSSLRFFLRSRIKVQNV